MIPVAITNSKVISPNFRPSIRKAIVMIEGIYIPSVLIPTTCLRIAIIVAIIGRSKIRRIVLSGIP